MPLPLSQNLTTAEHNDYRLLEFRMIQSSTTSTKGCRVVTSPKK